jgi:hypothetical protein
VLVPIAMRGLREADIAATRRTLLAMVANLAEDEIEATKEHRKMPSTREVARRLGGG